VIRPVFRYVVELLIFATQGSRTAVTPLPVVLRNCQCRHSGTYRVVTVFLHFINRTAGLRGTYEDFHSRRNKRMSQFSSAVRWDRHAGKHQPAIVEGTFGNG
jgi:hypothetical protein